MARMEVEILVISEISLAQKDEVSDLTHVWNLKKLVSHKLRMDWSGLGERLRRVEGSEGW